MIAPRRRRNGRRLSLRIGLGPIRPASWSNAPSCFQVDREDWAEFYLRQKVARSGKIWPQLFLTIVDFTSRRRHKAHA